MRKNVLLIAGLAVLSTSAFASRARMAALGTGSAYVVGDTTTVFINPASLNGAHNLVLTEWGAADAANSDAAPRAEGGFFREQGSMTYGLYLGNGTSRIAHDTASGFLAQTNGADFFLAGDAGMKWGARVHYASRKDETGAVNKKNSAFGLGLGMTHGDLGAYLNMDLSDKSTGATGSASYESKTKPSYTLGLGYDFGGVHYYAEMTSNKQEKTVATTTTYKYSKTVVGAGKVHELNPTSRVMYNAMLSMEKDENITATGTTKTNKLPVTVGLEADATSWLTLRGSLSQNVLINNVKNVNGKNKTTAGTTAVNAGAALTFGKLTVDGMIGTTDVSRTGTAGSTTGNLSTDNLLTQVGMTYKF